MQTTEKIRFIKKSFSGTFLKNCLANLKQTNIMVFMIRQFESSLSFTFLGESESHARAGLIYFYLYVNEQVR